jgi:hypothetical protein
MSNLQDHVPQLETCKKMKKLGWKKKVLYQWVLQDNLTGEYKCWNSCELSEFQTSHLRDKIPAPLASEIGEELPMSIWEDNEPLGIMVSTRDKTFVNSQFDMTKKWKIWYEDLVVDDAIIGFSEENEAEARAKMWIYLKEKKII